MCLGVSCCGYIFLYCNLLLPCYHMMMSASSDIYIYIYRVFLLLFNAIKSQIDKNNFCADGRS